MFEKLGTPAFLAELRGSYGAIRPFSVWRTLLAFLIVYMIASFAQGMALTGLLLCGSFVDKELWAMLMEGAYASDPNVMAENMLKFLASPLAVCGTLFASALLGIFVLVYCRKFEKRTLSSMGMRKKRLPTAIFGGVLCAALLFLFAFLFAFFFDAVSYDGVQTVRPVIFVFVFLGILVQAFAEEIMFRGGLLPSLASGMPLSYAMLISAAAYALLQPMGSAFSVIAFINSFLLGLLLSLFMIRTGSLFTGAVAGGFLRVLLWCVFGSPVFGLALPERLFSFTLAEGAAHIHGGAYGMVGGIAVSFALVLGIAFFAMKKTRTD